MYRHPSRRSNNDPDYERQMRDYRQRHRHGQELLDMTPAELRQQEQEYERLQREARQRALNSRQQRIQEDEEEKDSKKQRKRREEFPFPAVAGAAEKKGGENKEIAHLIGMILTDMRNGSEVNATSKLAILTRLWHVDFDTFAAYTGGIETNDQAAKRCHMFFAINSPASNMNGTRMVLDVRGDGSCFYQALMHGWLSVCNLNTIWCKKRFMHVTDNMKVKDFKEKMLLNGVFDPKNKNQIRNGVIEEIQSYRDMGWMDNDPIRNSGIRLTYDRAMKILGLDRHGEYAHTSKWAEFEVESDQFMFHAISIALQVQIIIYQPFKEVVEKELLHPATPEDKQNWKNDLKILDARDGMDLMLTYASFNDRHTDPEYHANGTPEDLIRSNSFTTRGNSYKMHFSGHPIIIMVCTNANHYMLVSSYPPLKGVHMEDSPVHEDNHADLFQRESAYKVPRGECGNLIPPSIKVHREVDYSDIMPGILQCLRCRKWLQHGFAQEEEEICF